MSPRVLPQVHQWPQIHLGWRRTAFTFLLWSLWFSSFVFPSFYSAFLATVRKSRVGICGERWPSGTFGSAGDKNSLLNVDYWLFSGLPNNKSQHQRSQERLNLATNGLEKTSDIVTDDSLSEDRQTETWTPVAGDLQEVTYAQLDHDSLTQRTVKDVTPQNRVIMAESSTYAAIMRCWAWASWRHKWSLLESLKKPPNASLGISLVWKLGPYSPSRSWIIYVLVSALGKTILQ